MKTEALANSQFTIGGLSNECKEVVRSLPRERNWDGKYLYQYHGFWFRPDVVESTISFKRHFKAQDTDIILSSMPKSGAT